MANFGVLHRARQAFSSAENVGTGLFGSGLPRITVSVQLRHLQAPRSQGPKPDFHRKSKTSPSSDLSVSWPSPPRATVSHLQGPNRPEKSQIGRFEPRCTKSTFWGFFVSGSIRPQNSYFQNGPKFIFSKWPQQSVGQPLFRPPEQSP